MNWFDRITNGKQPEYSMKDILDAEERGFKRGYEKRCNELREANRLRLIKHRAKKKGKQC